MSAKTNNQDPLVIFTPSGRRGHFPVGTPILSAARTLGVDLDSVCGGRGICSKCQITPSYGEFSKHGVTVQQGALSEWNKVEERYKSKRGLIDGRRPWLSGTGDGAMWSSTCRRKARFTNRSSANAPNRADIIMDPATKLFYVEVEEPDMHKPTGDLERLQQALFDQWGLANVIGDLRTLQTLQKALRDGKWKVTCAVYQGAGLGSARITQVWPGYYEGSIYGLAFDVGSTTIACHMCDLQSGDVIASSGLMNPQIRFGEDLMSRVSYSMMNPGGAEEMTKAVRETINALIGQVAAEGMVEREAIMEAVLVGNPVMHHLLLGIDPVELGWAPFALATSNSLQLWAKEIDLEMHPDARIYILPCIAGHVGADAAAVALSEAPNLSDDLVLVVDVGTNAEIMLGDREQVLACSSPTGPAFEGAQISSGQRAAPGAIEKVEIDPVTKDPRFRVIGSDKWSDEDGFTEALGRQGVTGICGSGIIEVIAEMRLAGIIDEDGAIGSASAAGTQRCIEDGRTHAYLVHEAADGTRITVTQQDIRAIQLAKAALYAGARLLMDKRGVDTVDRVVLAGAFGAHISPKHAMVLGMIPDCPLDKVSSAGNAAGTGARIALLNSAARREIESVVRRIEKIETAVEPRFQEHFVNAIAVPHKVDPHPEMDKFATLPKVSFGGGSDSGEDGGRRKRRRARA